MYVDITVLTGIESNALPGWPRNSVKVTERTRGRIDAGARGTAQTRDINSDKTDERDRRPLHIRG